jgi:phosphoglycolate phosphatase-like HAD superfamily hydrolase
MKVKDGVRNLISSLKYAKVPTFLVTDLTDQVQLRKLVKLNLEEAFDEIISSELAGGDKVTDKPFQILFNLLDPKILERPIFIGDSIQDFPNFNNIVDYPINSKVRNFCFSKTSNYSMKIEKVKNFREIESKIFVANE